MHFNRSSRPRYDQGLDFSDQRNLRTLPNSACCRGFWNRHKNQFAAGQLAQRLGLVVFVEHNNHT